MEYARFCPPYLPLYQIFLRLLTNEWGKRSNLDLIPNVFFLQKLNVYRTQYLLLSLIPTSFASVPKVCRIFARQMTNLFWPQKSSQALGGAKDQWEKPKVRNVMGAVLIPILLVFICRTRPNIQIVKYPNIWLIWLFGYLSARSKRGQVGYPWKEHEKCSSEALTGGP